MTIKERTTGIFYNKKDGFHIQVSDKHSDSLDKVINRMRRNLQSMSNTSRKVKASVSKAFTSNKRKGKAETKEEKFEIF